MFTGLIEDIGILAERQTSGEAAKLVVKTSLPLDEIRTGDSIAVNGVCLTVEAIEKSGNTGKLVFYTLPETLEKTNLGMLPVGAGLNVERAVRTGDRLGGHIVTGHIDTTVQIKNISHRQKDSLIAVDLPDDLQTLVIPQGSIAVDGISLTIAELKDREFCVAIIPHTWQMTNLTEARVGKIINIETDVIGKYAQQNRSNEEKDAGLSFEDLKAAGFS